MTKKFIAILLSVLMLTALFAGCATEGAKSSDGSASGAKSSADSSKGDSSVSDETDWEYVKGKGKLVVGITDYEPMNYYAEDGSLTGFDTEYTKLVCEKLDIDCEFIEIDWDFKEMELDSRNIDCIWNGVTYTEARDENMDFSDPYIYNGIVVVIRSEDAAKYKTLADLSAATIVAEGGSSGEDCVAADENLSKATYVAVGGLADALREVSSYTADAAVVDSTMAEKVVGTGAYEGLQIMEGSTLSEEVLAIGFRTGSDLVELVNNATDELIAEGTLVTLAEKYGLNLITD